MHALREAIEARDFDRIDALLAPNVRFSSPVAHKPYGGAPITSAILAAVLRVFEDFTYVREIDGGSDSVLEFTARIGGLAVNGVDILHVDDEGLIDDFKVMVRPLSAATALAERMAVEFAAETAARGLA